MKMLGSNYWDTLFGTAGADVMHGRRGNDRFISNGDRDQIYGEGGNDLISGLSFDLSRLNASASRGSLVNGGSGSDTLILDIAPAAGVSLLAKATSAMTITSIEEIIFNVGPVTSKQTIAATEKSETICASGDARVNGMGGNDYIFTTSGDDTLLGGDGNDFLSGGVGHNTLTGGKGSDFFVFGLTRENANITYQYSNVTDFQNGKDKIAILIDNDQLDLLHGTDREDRLANRGYGAWQMGDGNEINEFVSYNNGRYFDRSDFSRNQDLFDTFVTYEKSTGSILLNYYEQIDDNTLGRGILLVAHVDGNPNLTADDFTFLVM